jgi:hypothetical protein
MGKQPSDNVQIIKHGFARWHYLDVKFAICPEIYDNPASVIEDSRRVVGADRGLAVTFRYFYFPRHGLVMPSSVLKRYPTGARVVGALPGSGCTAYTLTIVRMTTKTRRGDMS